MSTQVLNKLEDLLKSLELGSYNAAPGTLNQGAALQIEDCSPVMHNVTFGDAHLKLQKDVKVEKARGQLVQFQRQLSYGTFGGSAQPEGQVGIEQTSDYVRAVVPMAYYTHIRRVTVAANLAETQDGVKAEDREAMAATKKLAGDIEFDLFRGKDDFSNGGVFDGSPLALPRDLAGIDGLGLQVRESDNNATTQDLMFDAFGSGLSNVISVGGTLTQPRIEDSWIRGILNMGTGDRMFMSPLVLSAYNKASYANKERFNLGGSAQEVTTGVDIRRQAVSGGVVSMEQSRFLVAQYKPVRPVEESPGAPTFSAAQTGGSTSFAANEVYTYKVTGANRFGESLASAAATVTIAAAANQVTLTITAGSGKAALYYNVYRSAAGSTDTRLVGKVKATASGGASFVDLNNRLPGGTSAFLVQTDTLGIHQLMPYSKLKIAQADWSIPEAHGRFLTLAVYEPRKDVILDNCLGSL